MQRIVTVSQFVHAVYNRISTLAVLICQVSDYSNTVNDRVAGTLYLIYCINNTLQIILDGICQCMVGKSDMLN